MPLEPAELAHQATQIASDRQAEDVVMLDIRPLCDFADYFVIFSGESERQLRAIVEELDEKLAKAGAQLHHREGDSDSGWVLLDFGDVIIHAFDTELRAYYALEDMWSQARTVVRIQ